MAKTKTTYSSHPKLLQICSVILIALSLTGLIVYIVLGCFGRYYEGHFVSMLCYFLMLGASCLYSNSGWIEVDDESRTLTTPHEKKHPVDIMKIDRIARHVSKNGKVRYLTVHEAGVRYIDIRINRSGEPVIIENLRKINPAIEVVTYTA